MLYFDASALVKRYVREKGSLKVRRLLSSDGVLTTCRLSAIEIASALARRSREGAFTTAERDRALAALDADMSTLLIAELTPEIDSRARSLLQRHPLRAGDAIQLASALYLHDELGESPRFVVFDDRLSTAAKAEGLKLA